METILTPTQFQSLATSVAKLIAEQGLLATNSIVLITAFIILFLVFLGIMIYLIKASANNQGKLLEQQRQYNNETLNRMTRGFDGINQSILGIYEIINDEKKLDKDDFRRIANITTSNTLLLIYTKLILIIERNNLVKQEDNILIDIKNTIDRMLNLGREDLKNMQFNFDLETSFFAKTEQLKKSSYKEVSIMFKESISRIRDIEIEIDTYRSKILELECADSKTIFKVIEDYDKLRHKLSDEYSSLKRAIYAELDEMINKTKELINNI